MRLLLLVVAIAGCAGCSTIVSRPLQKVTATSEPPGAAISADGLSQGITPAVFELGRWQDHDLTLELRGYQPYQVHLKRRLNPWVFGNIFNILPIGVAVDASTGAMYKLDPAVIHAELSPEGTRRRRPSPTFSHK